MSPSRGLEESIPDKALVIEEVSKVAVHPREDHDAVTVFLRVPEEVVFIDVPGRCEQQKFPCS